MRPFSNDMQVHIIFTVLRGVVSCNDPVSTATVFSFINFLMLGRREREKREERGTYSWPI